MLDCYTVEGTLDADTFYDFIQRLLKLLMPFNGVNPHSVVILDNASVHHVQGIVEMINEVGALVLFLPPYSPDFNPIEEAFSRLKALIKVYEMEHLEMEHLDLEDIVLAASLLRTANAGLPIVEFTTCSDL